jgi:protein-arginine kinase activator protein McsA
MKDVYDKMISNVIRNINWSRIKHFHHILDLKWQFPDTKGHIVERHPTVTELKEELKTLINFAIKQKEKTFQKDLWLIEWDCKEKEGSSPSYSLEVFFVLEEAVSVETGNKELPKNVNELESRLNEAVEHENFELAAEIRDLITSLKEKEKN